MKQNKQNILVTATLMSLLVFSASCTMDQVSEKVEQPGAIDFNVYALRTPSATRAGATGDVSTVNLQTPSHAIGHAGIGVFGYYTGRDLYNHLVHKPNFMHNVQVTYVPQQSTSGVVTSPARWEYSPVMYWPNEYEGDYAAHLAPQGDRLSFFAYAPYVEVDRTTGFIDDTNTDINQTSGTKSGIIGMTDHYETGNPLIHYAVGANPDEAVDLCWATAGPSWSYEDISGATVKRDEGMPLVDLTRMKSYTNKIGLTLRHALAKLNVQIDGAVDEREGEGVDNASTHIYLRRVIFSGFALRGSLDLCNSTASKARWLEYGGSSVIQPQSNVLNDGRTEGREGEPAGTSPDEENQLLNPELIQTDDRVTTGVTGALQNLFASNTATSAQLVIPDGTPLSIAIEYDIETADPKLLGQSLSDGATIGKSLECRVSKSDIVTLEAGKAYTICVHLGLTAVKVDVTDVKVWN